MKSFQKKLRQYYWLVTSFTKKNFKFIVISCVAAFFGIVFIVNFFPLFSAVLSSGSKTVGLVGQHPLQSPPAEVTSLISSPLITIDAKGDIVPVLANSWEVLNEGKTYRFHLRNDLLWHDGNQFSASDINYNFQGVTQKPIDDFTIDFNLSQPLTIFPIYLVRPVIKTPLVGVAGKYKVQSLKATKNIIDAVHLSPISRDDPYITFKFYKTEEELITAYQRGSITSFTTPNAATAEKFSSWKNTDIERAIDYSQITSVFFNTSKDFFKERDVRKGIAQAVPEVTKYGVTAKSPIPPTSWAYNDAVKETHVNLDKAKTLLEKNLTSSDSGKITLYTFYDYINLADEMKFNLSQVGLTLNLKIISAVSQLPSDYDLFLTAWSPPSDPDQYFFWHSTQENTNVTKFNNAKIDKLLEDGRRIINNNQRKKVYDDFQKTITDEQPAVFLYHPYIYTISRK